MLRTRALGRTGMEITRVGFGAWAIGGDGGVFGWGPQDDDDSIAAIRHGIELGINWIDTAAIYGLGHSEEVVARALEAYAEADRPYVFTKCGLRFDRANPKAPAQRLGTATSIKADAEDSLRRLGVERIDLFQMHWPAEAEPVEEYWQALLDLQAEGKIAAAALSNHDVAALDRAEALGHVEALQPPFSPINRRVATAILPWCAAHETGVIIYSPMQSGLLSGRWSRSRAASLAADDWRRNAADFNGESLERNLALVAALEPVAARYRTSMASIAIAWTLAFTGVTAAIVGARSPAQIDDWVGAGEIELSAGDLDEIAAAIETTGAGEGPARP